MSLCPMRANEAMWLSDRLEGIMYLAGPKGHDINSDMVTEMMLATALLKHVRNVQRQGSESCRECACVAVTEHMHNRVCILILCLCLLVPRILHAEAKIRWR